MGWEWSGSGKLYARVQSFKTKKELEQAKKLLEQTSYGYNFGDGWFASVRLTEITAAEAKRIRARSDGFCGYDWMIDSIKKNGTITCD